MTKKQDLQKEILANVTAGITPSTLKKKLKKSKSDSDIPKTPLLPNSTPLSKSKSQLEIPVTQPSLEEQITNLKEQVKFHAETAANYLQSLQTSQARVSELEEKLKKTTTELDKSLEIRHQSLKDWTKQQEAIKSLNQELNEAIDQVSEEIVASDSEISNLRTKINRLKTAKENLENQLKLEQIKKGTHPDKPLNSTDNFLQYSFYALLALAILVSITVQEK